jgi:hypothetical protein
MRKICWFSCGAPSAVAAKISLSLGSCELIYTKIREEHEDNSRFLHDCEKWLDQPISILMSEKYDGSIFNVFRAERYLVGVQGAPCSKLLKRKLREDYQRRDDVHVLGYTIEEADRMDDFRDAYPELNIECPLIDRGLSKADCLSMIEHAGIVLPAMYLLGFNNNNCVGCVKGGMGYWNKIRRHFPNEFARMAAMERAIGHSINRRNGEPIYLDELPEDAGRDVPEPRIDCSIMCLIAIKEYTS